MAAECYKSGRIAKCTKGATKRARFGTETGQKQQLRDREQFSLSLNFLWRKPCPPQKSDSRVRSSMKVALMLKLIVGG